MSEKRAKMLNKRASKPKNKADKILEKLALIPGQFIADIGSGGGYFSYRFAELVGERGRVYAIDTNQEFLEFIKKKAAEQELKNIFTLHTSSEHPNLPKHMFDYIFFRNVTHHISNRINYFKSLSKALKSKGRIVIIEYDGRGGFFSFQRLHRHFIPKDKIIEEMKQAGYKLQKSYDFLSDQSFSIFSLN
ncbi:MAG: hypothetical protein AYK22_02130 [Thermoplasmatales archaeon SG8-52-3]|nr:MAG: hypothetical protein AYK22_02130 [Thermoplasmatales archaeon SG8-52-3]